MKNAAGWVLGVVGALALTGCGLARRPTVSATCPVVEAALQAVGGREAWEKVKRISVVALVTVYDAKGSGYVDRQYQEIDLAGREIASRGRTPGGRWRATAKLDGSGQVVGPLFGTDIGLRKRMVAALAMALHRVAGPLNFVFGPEVPRSRSPARIAGVDLVRVGVGGDSRRAVAYYFEPRSKMLRFVTSGGDRAAAKGTVTEYTYMRLPNGMAFPESIRVVRIGQNALIGPQRVLAVEFSHVRIR